MRSELAAARVLLQVEPGTRELARELEATATP
jgi:hypothetical protein